MAPLELEGETLGKKHQSYNKLLKESSIKELLEPSQDDDIRNLLNIDIASKNRNVDYIVGVLKSEDELYVSKAIKRSIWLITDPQYAHIINPDYIYKELFPHMTTKGFNKLMLQIRLHLRDEKRVEAFYKCIKENHGNAAYKWLQHCSVPFVETVIAECNRNIPDYLVGRLFEKSFSIYEAYHKNLDWMINESHYIIKNHTDKYLDFIEKIKDRYYYSFSANDTEILMTKCSQRIIDKIDFYGKYLHIATFAKYLNKKENIEDFIMKHYKNDTCKWLFSYNNVQHFVKLMPKERRFEFVKKIFIDKDVSTGGVPPVVYDTEVRSGMMQCCAMKCSMPQSNTTSIYQWYKFAPFEVAFPDLKKLIRSESSPDQRTLILQILLTCAGRNMQHKKEVLQYYYDKHINEPFKFKINFVNTFISKVDTHSLDDQTWGLLNQLFHSMEVFIESENNTQSCIKAIIIRSAIRNDKIPDIVEKKFKFDTLNTYNKKIKNQKEKDAVFKYLYNFITKKNKSLNLTIESEFGDAVKWCQRHFELIKDWERELHNYPEVIARVKELIKVKKEKQWDRDFTSLYNIKKSWRKEMFEESIDIMQNDAVFVNALKHDPMLLTRNSDQVLAICCNDTVSLKYTLRKLRIYWPSTLSEHWKTEYLKNLCKPNGHKATINGLCTLETQEKIVELLKTHAPSDTKINWNETDQLELSLRKQIAKQAHNARPLIPIPAVLLYAKGDYLQYAVPSLNSILNQLSPNHSRLYIPTLLDSPVSLQKFGVRCAFQKLNFEELNPMLSEIWNSTKNNSIRTVLFTQTFDLLCKEKNIARGNAIWELLSVFIDNLNSDENKLVYTKLGEVSKVPENIKPQFFMKSYTFLSSLPAKCNCENILSRMQRSVDDFMDSLDNDFVVNILLKSFVDSFIKTEYLYDYANILAKFVLASKDEGTQLKRYEMALDPLLEKYLPLWDTIVQDSTNQEGKYRVKSHIKRILQSFAENLSYTFENKMQIPYTIFEIIQTKLDKRIPYEKDYVLLTSWKLLVDFVKEAAKSDRIQMYYKMEEIYKGDKYEDEKEKMYIEMHKHIRPQITKVIVQYLKEDLERFGNSAYVLFAKALGTLFYDYLPTPLSKLEEQIEYALSLLRYENDKYMWLVVQRYLKKIIYTYSDKKQKFEEVRDIVFSSCTSDEVKIHYYDMFLEYP